MRHILRRVCVSAYILVALLSCMLFSTLAAIVEVDQVELDYTSNQSTEILVSEDLTNHKSDEDGDAYLEWDVVNSRFLLTAKNSTSYTSTILWTKHTWHVQNYRITLTLTNNTSNAVEMQYTIAGEVDGYTVGQYKTTLLPGRTISFSLISKEKDSTATESTIHTGYVYIDNLRALENVDVSFASSTRGGYTYQIAGSEAETVLKGAEATASQSLTWGAEVTLTHGTPEEGYGFYGWMAGNTLLGTSDGTYAIQEDSVIYPVYLSVEEMSKTEPFKVGSNLYRLWTPAFADAKSSGNPVVINRDYTLPVELEDAGFCAAYTGSDYADYNNNSVNYKIPYGTILLIPYNDANTLITNDMDKGHYTSKGAKPEKTLYRELTMPTGTSITVNGAISVGSQACSQMVGQVGPYGAIVMENDSSITVKSGGNLYAYGYIFHGENGSGSINVESGATVYETAFVMDYPGSASKTQSLYNEGVFPMRAYSVRNVEVLMTFASGASEYAFYSIYGSAIGGEYPGYFSFLGNTANAPFCLGPGATATKSYMDGKTLLTVDGDGSLNPLNMTLKVSFIGTVPITSEATSGFPVPSGFDIAVDNGTLTMNDNFLMLEGTKLTICSEAELITNGKNIYVFDADDDQGAVSTTDIHGKSYTNVPSDAVLDVNGKITVNSGGGLYTSAGKAQIISSQGTGQIEYNGAAISDVSVLYRFSDGTNNESKNMNAAYLLNSDGSYTPTNGAATEIYTYIDGFWRYEDVAVWYDDVGAEKGRYLTLGQALSAYDGTGYIQMLTNTTESTVSTDKNLYLDLNGNVVTVTSLTAKTLYGLDSANNAYTASAGKIVGEVSNVADYAQYNPSETIKGKYYVSNQSGTTWTFHRFDLGIDSYTFYRNGDTGSMVFTAVFKGDEIACEKMLKKGFYQRGLLQNNGTSEGTNWYTGSDNTILVPVKTGEKLTGYTLTGTMTFDSNPETTYIPGFEDEFILNAATALSDTGTPILGPVYFAQKVDGTGITFNWAVENVTPGEAGEGQQ